ncbi:Vacuolar fusion protein mon1 [Dispira simplex]|nr:Vacuolar fusion protein mon1 [Dispira simplex]
MSIFSKGYFVTPFNNQYVNKRTFIPRDERCPPTDLFQPSILPGTRNNFGHEDPSSTTWCRRPKHFFVLSNAGKPIYSRYGDESRMSSLLGVLQAILSLVTDDNDTLESIVTGHHRFVFLLKGPLYLVAVAQTDEPERQLQCQLGYVYDQILSIVSLGQIRRIFESHSNFDLRKLITGTEGMLDHLIDHLGKNFSFALGSVESVRLPVPLRQRLGITLKLAKSTNVLYAVLATGMKLITLLRPKTVTLYSSDLHILLSTVDSFSSFKIGEHWIPICLPKFNAEGFLHVYICYITPHTCLLLLSTDKNRFAEMSEIKTNVVDKLTRTGDLQKLDKLLDESPYTSGKSV